MTSRWIYKIKHLDDGHTHGIQFDDAEWQGEQPRLPEWPGSNCGKMYDWAKACVECSCSDWQIHLRDLLWRAGSWQHHWNKVYCSFLDKLWSKVALGMFDQEQRRPWWQIKALGAVRHLRISKIELVADIFTKPLSLDQVGILLGQAWSDWECFPWLKGVLML